jgi:sterol desaturase/sphingolipid hydroxylase (fatty acid hydroxylase superfamily)
MVNEVEKWFILVSTPLFVILILGEIIFTHLHNRKTYSVSDTATNVYLMLANMGIDVLMRGVSVFVLVLAYENRFFDLSSNTWYYWLILFLLEDLIFYWIHRVDHMIRLFWAVHVTHHSSEKYNLTTGFRSSVFQPVYRFLWFIPLGLFGFKTFDIFIMFSITQTYGILVHTNQIKKLGFLEYILVTPSHHRVHHASNVEYLDKNMGMCLIIWDQLFGTFQPEIDGIEPKFGLYEKTIKNHPIDTVFHEFKSIISDFKKKIPLKIKLNYLLNPPGWSHDGSTKTSEQIRKELKQQKVS